jgi:glycerol-3-phosphate dehydrogenase
MLKYTREYAIHTLKQRSDKVFDIIVVGGGATGVGCAWAAVSHGYNVLLVEKHDFAKATSSRSTKLIHGGVRYLAQGNIRLVKESLKERRILRDAFPHLVKDKRFLIPTYKFGEALYYRIGLFLYDLLGNVEKKFRSAILSKKDSFQKFPNILKKAFRSSVMYYDGQFDDSRLVIEMVRKIWGAGGLAINYLEFENYIPGKNDNEHVLLLKDHVLNEELRVKSKIIIDTTGVFSEGVIRKINPDYRSPIVMSKGVHIVVDSSFADTKNALLIPNTRDGRVLFVVPWLGKVLIGTTDKRVANAEIEPKATDEEIEFILSTCQRYLEKPPSRSDILSVFAGLRALVNTNQSNEKTKEISRRHQIRDHGKGILSVNGGKWTTFRKMGEDALKFLWNAKLIQPTDRKYSLYNENKERDWNGENFLSMYGAEEVYLLKMIEGQSSLAESLDPEYAYINAQVIWAIEQEFAMKIEDVLARRLRILFLDAKAAKRMAPKVAQIMAEQLGQNEHWVEKEIAEFNALCDQYIL